MKKLLQLMVYSDINAKNKNRIIRATFVMVFVLIGFNTIAQNDSSIAKNTVYVEGLGNGGFYSLNYDRIFYHNKFYITGRIGLSYLPPFYANNNIFLIPIEICMLYSGKDKKHFAEFALASTSVSTIRNEDFTSYDFKNIFGIRFGYRLQKPSGGLFIKTGVLISLFDKQKNVPFTAGFGIGYTLKKQKK